MIKNDVSQHPRVYYCRHMQPGIARYADETILVDTHGMKALISSVKENAIPVYVEHQDVKLDTLKQDAAGYVTESFYNSLDGWAWFKFVAVDDSAHDAIKKGWSVSNAYKPAQWDKGGTKNNCAYDREIKAGEFTHLAIVANPRYENACILTPDEFTAYQADQQKKANHVTNSNPKGTTPMLKFFTNKKEPVAADAVTADTMVELQNGQSVSVADMVKIVENATKKEATVLVNGVETPISELKKLYENAAKMSKKNKKNDDDMDDDCKNAEDEDEDEDAEEEAADKLDLAKKNKKNKKNEKKNEDEADEDDKKDIKKDSKKNSKDGDSEFSDTYFRELQNANQKIENQSEELVEISQTQLERGVSRYGSKK